MTFIIFLCWPARSGSWQIPCRPGRQGIMMWDDDPASGAVLAWGKRGRGPAGLLASLW